MRTLYEVGDALKGERIAVRARKIGRIEVSARKGTSTHKIQTTKLTGSAYCVIERPLRAVRIDKMEPK